MKLKVLLENKSFRVFLIVIVSVGLLIILTGYTALGNKYITPLLVSIFKAYLVIPEYIANTLFSFSGSGVCIKEHQFIFQLEGDYQVLYAEFITNWTRFLLYGRFSLLLLVVIWYPPSCLKKKLIFTFAFIVVHLISVVGGLYLMGAILPDIITGETSYFVTPTLVGTFFMFSLLLFWVLFNKEEIRNLIQSFGLKIFLPDRIVHESLILLFFFLILRNYLIPFISFKPYVHFLLYVTREAASLFQYDGYIDGLILIGKNGALALSKHCLGFMTMYLFAALVFLTRPRGVKLFTTLYITFGTAFIFLLNLVRLVLVFIVAQSENGYVRANRHHEIYNIVIYVVVFILWVLWFDLIKRKIKPVTIEGGN